MLPWHNPILLAEQAATIDLMSNGRLEFGVGKGYRHNEFAAYVLLNGPGLPDQLRRFARQVMPAFTDPAKNPSCRLGRAAAQAIAACLSRRSRQGRGRQCRLRDPEAKLGCPGSCCG